jgi:translation initiation factor 2 subunit 2
MDNYQELLKRAKQNLPEIKGGGRLEIPSAIVEVVKKTTSVKNFGDIAKAIRRDAKHLARFMFKELAVPGALKGNELVLQGKISSTVINQRLQEYLKEYVYCKECGKPDTNLVVEGNIATIKCEACGARRTFKVMK